MDQGPGHSGRDSFRLWIGKAPASCGWDFAKVARASGADQLHRETAETQREMPQWPAEKKVRPDTPNSAQSALLSSNLDVVMDTMNNIIGILMQVDLGQSLKKEFSELPRGSPEELARIKEDANDQATKHEQLKDFIEKQRLRSDRARNEGAIRAWR